MPGITYTIALTNSSGRPCKYYLFSGVSNQRNVNTDNLYINAFAGGSRLPPNSPRVFYIPSTTYAICGQGKLHSGLGVEPSGSAQVTVGASTVLPLIVDDQGVRFGDATQAAQENTSENGFTVKVPSFNQTEKDVWIGIGHKNDDGDIIPLVVSSPTPDQDQILYPVESFYIITGDYYETGKLLAVRDLGYSVAKVDFTNNTTSTARVVHQPNGTFSVGYTR